MNKKLTQLSASLLLSIPLVAFAQSHGGGGGGPPAGVGSGVGGGGGVSGAVGGIGHAGGLGGSATGAASSHASDMSSLSDTGMSRSQAHRLELKAKKEAAAAKAAAAQAQAQSQGSANANENAAFGQSTAASARTLKDADPATRAAFHDTVTAGAKLQGKGNKSGSDEVDETESTESTEPAESDGSRLTASASGKGSAQVGTDHANS
ncbi:MAG: hypothetical protein ABIP44_11300, partial [Pseudoxanthomonas sp.]